MGAPLRVGTDFNKEAPHGCFLFNEGSDEFMGFNDNTGGTNESFTHRLCCGAETVPMTTTTTTVPWILHDECLFNPCGMAPNTYDFPATPFGSPLKRHCRNLPCLGRPTLPRFRHGQGWRSFCA